MARSVAATFGLPAAVGRTLVEPDAARDSERGQWSAPEILRYCLAGLSDSTYRLLAVTGRDIYSPFLSFVYGQAQLDGPLALVSLARLSQQFYGLPENDELLVARAAKEAVHELGHTFGLVHCPIPVCVMSLATNILHIDRKSHELCSSCGKLLRGAGDGIDPEEFL